MDDDFDEAFLSSQEMQNILAEADLKSQQLARRAHVNMENMPREVIAAILERLEAESLLSAASACRSIKQAGWDIVPFAMRLRFGAPSPSDPQLVGWGQKGPGAADGPSCACPPHGPCLSSAVRAIASAEIRVSLSDPPRRLFAEPPPEAVAHAQSLLVSALRETCAGLGEDAQLADVLTPMLREIFAAPGGPITPWARGAPAAVPEEAPAVDAPAPAPAAPAAVEWRLGTLASTLLGNPALRGFWADAALLLFAAGTQTRADALCKWLIDASDCGSARRELCIGRWAALDLPYAVRCVLLLPAWAAVPDAHWLAAALSLSATRRAYAEALAAHAQQPGGGAAAGAAQQQPGGAGGQRALTLEQRAVTEITVERGRPKVVKVIAAAGSGKSTCLRVLAMRLMASNRVLYTAYNKAVVSDFDSSVPRGPNVPLHVKTTHSLSGLCGAYSRKVFDGPNSKAIRWEAYKVLKALEKKSEAINPRTRKALTEPFVSLAMAVVNDFLNTISGEISLEGITSANLLERIGKSKFEPGDVMQVAKRIHELAMDRHDDFPCCHDHYLRAFILREPRLKYDVILIDEAQDMTPLTLKLFLDQAARPDGPTVVFVGDPNQHIYFWNGTRNAIRTLQAHETFRLTGCFRFDAHVAADVNKLLSAVGETSFIRGLSGRAAAVEVSDTLVVPPEGAPRNVYLVRSWAGALEQMATLESLGIGGVLRKSEGDGGRGDLEQSTNLLNQMNDIFVYITGQGQMTNPRMQWIAWASAEKRQEMLQIKLATDQSYPPLYSLVTNKLEQQSQGAGESVPAFIARLRRHLEWSHANPERVRVDISTPHQFKGREADTVQVDPLLCAEVLDNVRVIARGADGQARVQELSDSEREAHYLLHVAVTRARRKLIIPNVPKQRMLESYGDFSPVPPPFFKMCSGACCCAAAAGGPPAV